MILGPEVVLLASLDKSSVRFQMARLFSSRSRTSYGNRAESQSLRCGTRKHAILAAKNYPLLIKHELTILVGRGASKTLSSSVMRCYKRIISEAALITI